MVWRDMMRMRDKATAARVPPVKSETVRRVHESAMYEAVHRMVAAAAKIADRVKEVGITAESRWPSPKENLLEVVDRLQQAARVFLQCFFSSRTTVS